MFLKIELSSDMALKFSEILISHAEHNPGNPNIHSILHIAHSLWSAWYQSKCWTGRPDPKQIIMCEAWVLLCIQVLTEELKRDQSNEHLQTLFRCFTVGRQVVVEASAREKSWSE